MSCDPIKDKEDIKNMLEALALREQGFRDSLFFEFMLSTALRIGDALRVRKKDIDFDSAILTIRTQKNQKRRESDRRIALNHKLLRKLEIYLEHKSDEDLLFTFKRQWAHKLIKYAADFAGLNPEKISLHSTRKTAAWFFYLQSGKDIVKTQKFLGHKDPKETQIYLKISDEEVNEQLKEMVWS